MGSSVLISVDEYLSTDYAPDRDYVDGELEERNMGEQSHANVQSILSGIFRDNRKAWNVRALTEQRVQVTSTRFRIPDVCILRNTDPKDEIITFPPFLCLEVLSMGQTLARHIQPRISEYMAMGVQHCWVVDPWKRLGYVATEGGFQELQDGQFRVEGTPIAIRLADVFAELDEF